MDITLNPKKIVIILGTIIILLVLASIVGLVSKYYLDLPNIFGLFQLFNLDREKNIPTYFSSVLLLLAASLLYFIAIANKKQGEHDYLYWIGLAAVFVFLSIDEFTVLHERLITPIKTRLNTSGLLHFAWVIPGGGFVVIMMLIYRRFTLNLPKRIKRMTIIAGLIYVAGAIGVEMIGGYYRELHEQRDITYEFITTCEESMEMIGIMIFVYALMSYIDLRLSNLTLRISSSKQRLQSSRKRLKIQNKLDKLLIGSSKETVIELPARPA
jgi:uncharacterized BrkB/YihY/UPF0761 family membrane protein